MIATFAFLVAFFFSWLSRFRGSIPFVVSRFRGELLTDATPDFLGP